MLCIKFALMRIAGATVFAERIAAQTHTVKALVYDDAITGGKIFDLSTCFFDHAADFMTQNLRIDLEGNRLPVLVGVVVRVPGEDVSVGSAKPNGGYADDHFMRPRTRQRNIAHLEPFDAAE